MTTQIYRRVAPSLTIYSIGAGINPTMAGERLTGILREAGFKYFVGSQGVAAYLIRAEAKSSKVQCYTRGGYATASGWHSSINFVMETRYQQLQGGKGEARCVIDFRACRVRACNCAELLRTQKYYTDIRLL
jgi:hypothetical protein